MLWQTSRDERAQALCANFVLQATNTQGLETRLAGYRMQLSRGLWLYGIVALATHAVLHLWIHHTLHGDNYRMVGNFRKGFTCIFAFFVSQEPFAKIKTAKISLSTCEVKKPCFNPQPSYTATNRIVSASVPLTAIAEAIQKIKMLAM